MREQRECREKVQDIPCRPQLAPINIDGVAHGLESVEADAYRKREREHRYLEIRGKEVTVFEKSKCEQVTCNGNGQNRPAMKRLQFQRKSSQVIHHAGDHQQDQESPIPPSIKEEREKANVKVTGSLLPPCQRPH